MWVGRGGEVLFQLVVDAVVDQEDVASRVGADVAVGTVQHVALEEDRLAALIRAAEDLADVEVARAARQEMIETGETPIPWDDVLIVVVALGHRRDVDDRR